MDTQMVMQHKLQAHCGKGGVRTVDGRHQQSLKFTLGPVAAERSSKALKAGFAGNPVPVP
jgi:hypothetical protein